MAYVKIKCIHSSTHLQQAIDYIKNPDKTEKCVLISSYMCSAKNALFEFEQISQEAINRGNQIAHHICQSFSSEDNITPERALEIGKTLMRNFYPNHQYVIAAHTDRNHIHNHIIINAVNFENYKKLRSTPKSLQQLRNESDKLCRENNLSVIVTEEKNKRKQLKNDIDTAIENSNTFEDFLGYMQSKNYEIKQGKYLYFKAKSCKVFLNTNLLGSGYTQKNIMNRIANHMPVENHKIHIYDSKIVKMSYRKRLKLTIDKSLEKSNTYDDFLRYMTESDYIVKFGKHLAFKHITGERFIRCDSLGENYSESMLKLYFSDRESYNKFKDINIKNLAKSGKAYRNKYIEAVNVNIDIAMLNYLKEHRINSLEELKQDIDICKNTVNINSKNLQNINGEILKRKEIIKSLRAYWQYKPYMSGLKNCKTADEREKYQTENKYFLEKFNHAVDVINRSKKADGSLPKAVDLNLEIEKFEKAKDEIERKNLVANAKLNRYKVIENNLKIILSSYQGRDMKSKNETKENDNRYQELQ